jgi:signal transduction histidine kinase
MSAEKRFCSSILGFMIFAAMRFWHSCIFLSLLTLGNLGAQTIELSELSSGQPKLIGDQADYIMDSSHQLQWDDLGSVRLERSDQSVITFSEATMTYWFRFRLHSEESVEGNYVLDIRNPLLDSVDVYLVQSGQLIREYHTGDRLPYSSRPLEYNSFAFPIFSLHEGEFEVLVRIRSSDQLLIPFYLGESHWVSAIKNNQELIFGIYIGLMLVMYLYNGFIWISTRDNSYLYYVTYVGCLMITQMILEGTAFHRLFPNSPAAHNFGVVLFSSLTGIAAMEFTRKFLGLKNSVPRLNNGLYVFEGIYVLAVVFRLSGMDAMSFRMLDIGGLTSALYVLGIAIWLVRSGREVARLYLTAWSFFIAGVLIYVLKNFGVLPFNTLTISSIQIGSAIEVVLLSFALANRINVLRIEREESQLQTLELTQENERLIKEQNTELEGMVAQRTKELQETLNNLKEAQAQLVEAEKMVSLGQLTAGIAHEINNPINFVSSNINPLRRDIQDLTELIGLYEQLENAELDKDERKELVHQIAAYKEEIDLSFLKTEIDELLNGIDEGASRTAEIVHGLRTFSRLDEGEFKESDIQEGLDSTLALLNSKVGDRISIRKDYADPPMVYCNGGKLNQVFMNLMSNALFAIEKNLNDGHIDQGELIIRTKKSRSATVIELEDNGCGMSKETRQKIFEPFFTTKDVGEGTGLGLSIAYTILQQHHARVEVRSELTKGSRFRITLPKNIRALIS